MLVTPENRTCVMCVFVYVVFEDKAGALEACLLPPFSKIIAGKSRPSGLGGHAYRWVSSARLGEDQKKRSQLSKHKVPIYLFSFTAQVQFIAF